MNEPRVKITVYVPESTRRRLKAVAALQGTTATALIENLVDVELERLEKTTPIAKEIA